MTWPTEQAREAVDRAIGAWSIDDAEDREHQTDTILDALAPHVAALVRAERAAALREAAEAWLHRGWGDTPRHADRVADRMAASQYAGDWLRDRAEAEEAGR